MKKIADSYEPHLTAKSKKDKNKEKSHSNVIPEQQTKELFQVLPFRCDDDLREEEEEEEEQEQKMFACIPYIPEIAHPLRRVLSKAGVNTIFSSGQKLQNILCGKNKTRPLPEKKKGVYKYQCPCSEKAIYVGQTARLCDLRWKEHKYAIEKKNWQHSGISQHYETCDKNFDTENASIITTVQSKSKCKTMYDLKVREALDIHRNKCGPGKGLNFDMGTYVKTDMWDPVLHTMDVS